MTEQKQNSMFCLSTTFFFLLSGRCLEREPVYFYERLVYRFAESQGKKKAQIPACKLFDV